MHPISLTYSLSLLLLIKYNLSLLLLMENVYQFNFEFILICRFTMKFCGLFFLTEYKNMYTETFGSLVKSLKTWIHEN